VFTRRPTWCLDAPSSSFPPAEGCAPTKLTSLDTISTKISFSAKISSFDVNCPEDDSATCVTLFVAFLSLDEEVFFSALSEVEGFLSTGVVLASPYTPLTFAAVDVSLAALLLRATTARSTELTFACVSCRSLSLLLSGVTLTELEEEGLD
jgi:hypothetical protein